MLRPGHALFGILMAGAATAQPPGFRPAPLPDGPGKAEVEATCVACHPTNLIVGSTGYTQDGWRYLTSKMIALEEPLAGTITQYLATHFAPKNDRRPTLVPGPAEITFQEWTVPTLGQRPRDPLQLEDGTIWWAGMYASLLGRLNPATGEMREYKLDRDARPHGIAADADGNIWYTGNGNGTVGKLDPETGEITVYPMPDPAARDPHTPIFNRDGHLWFTLQNSNMLGRLIPETGEIRLMTMPTERARPYGIKEDSKGNLWVAYNGSNKIARVNPATWEVKEFATPTPDTRIRRLALTSDDIVWYVDSARGYIGRLDPATGEIKTWPSPSGPASHPYAIEVVDDVIWYNESHQRPDALVRFDPNTEQFQSWAIPSGVGIIRHMRATPDGRGLVIHQSSTNTVGLVRIGTEAS
ncbi:MAG TPA: cytochrome C [Gammaproteobacteria bacterium]